MTYTCEIYKIRLLKCAKDNSFVLEEKAPHFTTWAKVTQNSIKSNNVTFTNTGYCITISCHIESWEFSEVGALEALLIPVHTPHDSRPGLPENLRHKPSVYNKNKLVKKKKHLEKQLGYLNHHLILSNVWIGWEHHSMFSSATIYITCLNQSKTGCKSHQVSLRLSF